VWVIETLSWAATSGHHGLFVEVFGSQPGGPAVKVSPARRWPRLPEWGAEAHMIKTRFTPARMLPAVVLGLLGIVVAASTMRADDWPARPVRILIPFTAGGAAGMLGRPAAEKPPPPIGPHSLP